ncbi:MAG TPA: histidine phosphatase family protein [Anaerolineales bacterium]|nr:histidine phosphatase family protein [Anaerolineales bacterium]
MTTVFLIRHGDNDFVKKARLAGWLPGVHLNAHGRAQAESLAKILQPVKLKAIYASPLERAMETAEPLSRVKGLQILQRAGLSDVDVGRWQGQSLMLLRRRKLWQTVQHAPSLARFPDGESFTQAQARAVAELEGILAEHKSRNVAVACFSHADIIRLIIAHYLGLSLDLFQRLTIQPASISSIHISDGSARILRINDSRATEGV